MEEDSTLETEAIVSQKPAKLLIVDDNENARNLLKRRLAVYGYEVMPSSNEEQAMSILADSSVDAIFMNMFLNGISSYDFLLKLKANSAHKNIPVIMISSDDDVELVVRCIEAGAEDYMVKPLNQTILKARLSNCIAKKEAHDKEIAYLAKIDLGQKQIVAQEKMASIGVLVSSISQELKNPLNFIINFSEVSSEICDELIKNIEIAKDKISSDVYEYLLGSMNKFGSNVKKISEYGKNADNILRFMLTQSNTSDGKKHPGNINKVIAQTITMLISSYKANGITNLPQVTTTFDNAIPHINLSIPSLSKAIYNILDNAIYSIGKKFDNPSDAKIAITTENLFSTVEIIIHDDGNGIKADIIDKIFNPFFTTKPEGTGPGLGLSTAKEVIEDHDGQISVNSIETKFAEFRIIITKPTA
ncbi:MAG: hybrid sensor histidine kinase/response regulator [Holosporaceae bacterium]|jgi:signal transduction histidine kinase|nr:hybrid sensor histidine kinase/response regulator [Holosporaceae bacterium]